MMFVFIKYQKIIFSFENFQELKQNFVKTENELTAVEADNQSLNEENAVNKKLIH
jgi:hypothetical protein